MKLSSLILLLIVFTSCNHAKRLQRVKQQFDEIGRSWALDHPCPPVFAKSDTTFISDSSDYYRYVEVIKNLSEGSDYQTQAQLNQERQIYNMSEAYKKTVDSLLSHPVIIRSKIIIHDSIPDKRAEQACRDDVQKLSVDLAAKDGQIAEKQKQLRHWIYATLALGAVILLYFGVKLSGLFSMKLPSLPK